MRYKMLTVFLLFLLLGFTSVNLENDNVASSYAADLPSWEAGPAKSSIINFVNAVSNPSSPMYVQSEHRRAFFDMDGTLLCEKPDYIEVVVCRQRLLEKVRDNPALAQQAIYRAVLDNDTKYLHTHVKDAILEAFAGESLTSYLIYCRNFLKSHRHPRLNLEYTRLFYLPMIELIDYLQQADFSVYVVSTSQQEFIRSLSLGIIAVPKQNIIGTMVAFVLQNLDEDAPHVFVRTRQYFQPYNADKNKVVRLRERGLLPGIIAVGNSMGDYAMLDGVSDNGLPNLVCIVDHDDPEREYEYHKVDLLTKAAKRKWLVISIKKDFRVVFQ